MGVADLCEGWVCGRGLGCARLVFGGKYEWGKNGAARSAGVLLLFSVATRCIIPSLRSRPDILSAELPCVSVVPLVQLQWMPSVTAIAVQALERAQNRYTCT